MRGVIFFFLLLCERSAKGDMYGIYYYVTTEFDYAERDSSHTAYGGVVLQRFELIKVCVERSERDCFA